MKKTIAIILASLIIFWACGGGDSGVTITPNQEPPVIIPPEPEPDQEIKPRTIFIYNAAKPEIGSSDGTNYYQMSDGHAANARDGFVAIGDILHGVDDTGESIISSRLPCVPDAVSISGYTWSFKIIDGTRTKIFKGPDEYGNYLDNQWVVLDSVATAGGDIVATDDQGVYHSAAEPDLKIRFAAHNGIMIHSMDAANHRAYIRGVDYDTRVAFSTNYFFGADHWVEADGIWYSWNGYTWDGTTLNEHATVMREFVTLWYSDRPVLVAVGSRIEHSEAVTYWIECNTGMMYRHTPSIDLLEEVILLYQGSGLRNDGINAKAEIKPVVAGDYLFYSWSGTVWKYEFSSGVISSFAAGVEIWRM